MTLVVGLAGSPRRRGNTETLLDRFLAGAEAAGAETEKLVASRLDVGGCISCDRCWEDGECVTRDDYEDVCNKLLAAGVIAVASPLYFWNVPAQLKTIIDRSQCLWARKFVAERPLPASTSGHARRRGVLLCVGGDPHCHFGGIRRTIRSFLNVHEADYWDDLLYPGLDGKGEIEEHPTALEEAYDLGYRSVAESWE